MNTVSCIFDMPKGVKKCPRNVSVLGSEEKRAVGKKNLPGQPLGMMIKVKPPAKKAKVDPSLGQPSAAVGKPSAEVQKCSSPEKTCNYREKPKEPLRNSDNYREDIPNVTTTGLVLYSDESDDDYHIVQVRRSFAVFVPAWTGELEKLALLEGPKESHVTPRKA
ncbi:hypothetical protein Cgig2_028418 [Carnegiea gigantea]|uniref:Uncharacterized protein n=1 Tax=Carnegiea gigantea TaxID=171969 RepID=A0A9Q1K222_9CARY|nr:hypothetical protein Cgig2_028418 [Carnegiea gigantea]